MNIHFVVPVFYLGISNTLLSILVAGPQLSLESLHNIPLDQWGWLLLVSGFAVTGRWGHLCSDFKILVSDTTKSWMI